MVFMEKARGGFLLVMRLSTNQSNSFLFKTKGHLGSERRQGGV